MDYLRAQGYTLIERDWRSGHRDIDIIMHSPDGRTVVFVEVKTRTSAAIMRPEDAVDIKKIRNIAYAANNYVKMNNVVSDLRFDIVSVVARMQAWHGWNTLRVRSIRFSPSERRRKTLKKQ